MPELRRLVDDAIWLAELVAGQLSGEPEAWGLLAGRLDEAAAANVRALDLAANPVEQDLLRGRLALL